MTAKIIVPAHHDLVFRLANALSGVRQLASGAILEEEPISGRERTALPC